MCVCIYIFICVYIYIFVVVVDEEKRKRIFFLFIYVEGSLLKRLRREVEKLVEFILEFSKVASYPFSWGHHCNICTWVMLFEIINEKYKY